MRRPGRDTILSHKRISRRALILGAAQAGFLGLLGWRMRHLQVEEADQFRLLAEENRIKIRLIPPARGEIFDRNGRVVAENVPSYRIMMEREEAGDVDAVIARLGALIDLDPDEVEKAREEMRRSGLHPATVADRVTWE